MKVHCPKCERRIGGKNLNAKTDVAVCVRCGEVFPISDLLEQSHTGWFDLQKPPQGVSFLELPSGWEIRSTTRSLVALFVVPFTAIWAGISIRIIYIEQIARGEFNLTSSLLGLPFLAASVALIALALMTSCGKVTVSVDANEGRVFTGVGPFGFSRRFQWDRIKTIEERMSSFEMPGSHGSVLVLKGQRHLSFGLMVSDERKFFISQAIRKLLSRRIEAT